MNKKFALTLLSSPAVFASMVSMVVLTQPAQAQSANATKNPLACISSVNTPKHAFVCERRQNPAAVKNQQQLTVAQAQPNQVTELKFTDEESDAAIALFGCDCLSCLNALRQLRSMERMAV
jgi:hypothetical protein